MKIKSIRRTILSSPKQYYDVIEAKPYNNFLIKTSSDYIVSHNCNVTDEVNFTIGSDIEKKKKKMLQMISQIDARMVSRFMHDTFLPTINFIISSKDSEQSFLDSYINIKRRNESKNTLIIDEPQWVIRNDKGTPDDPGAFYVAVGNKFLANELLPIDARQDEIDAFRAKGYTMLKVPPGYREQFETNLDGSLADIAGISLASSLKFLSGVRLNQAKTPEYRNPFTKDIIEVGDNPNDHSQYSDFFDLSAVSPQDISRPLFIHLDMSTGQKGKGDKTGIAGTWILGKKPTVDGESSSSQMFFKLAFSVSVKAPKGYNISFTKNMNFIKWLRDKGFNIKVVSADTYQSKTVLEILKHDGFNTKEISVDRLDASHRDYAYEYLKSCIYERRVQIYQKCDLLTDELLGLERMPSGKIDHTADGINCLTGDTKVSLVDGRELTMLDLVDEFNNGKRNWVYTINEKTLKIEPKLICNAFKSGTVDKLCKITLDNGKIIECTPEHRFMLRDGTYREAKDLKENDSLMPLCRKSSLVGKMPEHRLYYEPIEDRPADNEHAAKAVKENRKIVKIDVINKTADVYDLTIQDNHNFALTAGIFVHNSKDQSDGFAGSVYSASQFSDQYSYEYGDNLNASLDVTMGDSLDRRTQLIVDMQKEIARLYNDQKEVDDYEAKKRKEEYQMYKDISDGIIVI